MSLNFITYPKRFLILFILSGLLLLNPLLCNSSLAFTLPLTTAMNLLGKDNLPQAVEISIREDLARRTQLSPNQFTIKEARQQTWPDGCLGLPESGELCTQALVDGWEVKMMYQEQIWIYRTNERGTQVRLSKN